MKKENIEQLVFMSKIGNCVEKIEKVTGGLSHRMYKVITDSGVYAIKELNPGIMKRKEAYSNFVFSEEVTEIAKQNNIPVIGAIKINNDYYMIFNWLEGKVLKPEEITNNHCEIIGRILAEIHNINFSKIDDEKRKQLNIEQFEWDKYIKLAEDNHKVYLQLLKQNLDLLYKLNVELNSKCALTI